MILNIKNNLKKIVIISTMVFSHFANAEIKNSKDNIENLIKTFLVQTIPASNDENIGIQINPTGMQFKISNCSEPLNVALPNDANRNQVNAVKLSCNDVRPWEILIPVSVTVNAKIIVAKRTIPAKEMIMEEDIDYAFSDRNHLYNGFYKNKSEIVGRQASQVITPGSILTKSNTQQPVIVQRNQVIDIIARNNAIQVMAKGIAKKDGSLNEIIKVYNASSKRTLDAVVIASNKVEVIS